MLQVELLKLVQFRNYSQQNWVFKNRIQAVCGKNGTGKTNLLDALYYLGLTKSYTPKNDAQNIQQGQQGMRIEGQFIINNQPYKVEVIIRESGKKELIVNEEPIKKITNYIGLLPFVMVTPDDTSIITQSSELRRKYIDALLSQTSPTYLQHLIQYNKLLLQRNSLLKQTWPNQPNRDLLDIIDDQLSRHGDEIYSSRNKSIPLLIEKILYYYQFIAQANDKLNIQYESSLHQKKMLETLQVNYHKDLSAQRTTEGIHRDDLVLRMGEEPCKIMASQGQRKSLLFAMKMAEWDIIKQHKNYPPILLLDDVFEKLDIDRLHQLLSWVAFECGAQVFITDTDVERVENLFNKIGANFQMSMV